MRFDTKKMRVMGLATFLVFSMSACAAPQQPAATETTTATVAAETTVTETSAPESIAPQPGDSEAQKKEAQANREYLKAYFGIELSEADYNPDTFSGALVKIAGEHAPKIADLNGLSVIKAAVEAADFTELALSYPEEKVKGKALDAYVACALDTGMITESQAAELEKNQPVSLDLAESLLYTIADKNGDCRNYLGMSDDPDIYGKVDQAWNSFLLFDDGTLSEIGRKAVEQGISTGYGLKSEAFSSRFLPELTLQYGHSDIRHAHQLLGLMTSEGLRAKVQLEPKISIYQYLPEWGPAPETTPTYEVKQFGDTQLVYAVEYDMQLEFDSKEDMLMFDSVIKDYAKKNEGNEEAVGLIAGSWWQPLYSTVRTDMPSEDYHQIYDCVITNGIFSIHPFALPENKEQVVSDLQVLAGDLKVEPVERYCNTAFHNYMTGADYQ